MPAGPPLDDFRDRYAPRFLLVLISAVLLFPNLGNVFLWQDEAETALLARNILEYGYPRAFDGTQVITQNHGAEFNESWVWTWSPWLQFYITAGSFYVFGESTLAARLPFAMLALGSVVLLFLYALELTGNRRVAVSASLLMATSVPFLLHARQCRWYMVAVLSTIWLLHAYLRMQRGRTLDTVSFVAAACTLFHGNYLVLAYVLGGIGLHFVLASVRRAPRPSLRSMLVALVCVAVLNAPWVLYARIWSRPNPLEEFPMSWQARTGYILRDNVVNINGFLLPLVLAALVPVAWHGLSRRRAIEERGLTVLPLIIACALAVLCLQPWTYFRYLIGLIAPCSLLIALVVEWLFGLRKILGVAVLVTVIATNLFSLVLAPRTPRFDLWRYLGEITHDYDGPNEGVVSFLQAYGQPGQLVLTNYGQLPIAFYTRMRAVGFGQDPSSADRPDWIVIRRERGNRRVLLEKSRGMQPVAIDYPDLRWGNRPDPRQHHFRAVSTSPNVVIFGRAVNSPTPR